MYKYFSMKNYDADKAYLNLVADGLADLRDKMVYAEGAGMNLYIDEKMPSMNRPVKDDKVDVQLATEMDMENMTDKLTQMGWTETENRDTIRRFNYENCRVEIVHKKTISWVPTRVWLEKGLDHLMEIERGGTVFTVVPFPYYLANQLSTYSIRDVVGPRKSYEFTVAIFLMVNRKDWAEQITKADDPSLKLFLLNSLLEVKNNYRLQDAIKAELPPANAERELVSILKKVDELLFG